MAGQLCIHPPFQHRLDQLGEEPALSGRRPPPPSSARDISSSNNSSQSNPYATPEPQTRPSSSSGQLTLNPFIRTSQRPWRRRRRRQLFALRELARRHRNLAEEMTTLEECPRARAAANPGLMAVKASARRRRPAADRRGQQPRPVAVPSLIRRAVRHRAANPMSAGRTDRPAALPRRRLRQRRPPCNEPSPARSSKPSPASATSPTTATYDPPGKPRTSPLPTRPRPTGVRRTGSRRHLCRTATPQ